MALLPALLLLLGCGALMAQQPDALAQYLQGRFLYRQHCQLCHGERGDGRGEMAAGLQPKPRSLRQGWFKYRSTPSGFLPSDDDLRHSIANGISNTAMGAFRQFSEEDLDALLVYLKSFSRRWRKPDQIGKVMSLPEPPSWLENKGHAATQAVAGARLFTQHCSACHGAKADGRGPAAAMLRDAWGEPSPPADLRQPFLRNGERAKDLYRTLATGLEGTAMISFESVLSPQQRWQIIAWILLQRLPAPPTLGGSKPRP